MEQAVIYARYSSHNQTENSIEGQISAAERYAKDHNLNIIRQYIDRAKTGTNDNREAFQQMLADCKRHDFTVIIVWKVDRFGRNREEITFNKYKCKKEGVRVEYVAENLGDSNEAVILESVLEGMAEYFSKQLSTNVKRGLAESRKKGNYIGTAPYGLKIVDRKLVEDEEKSDMVRNIFRRYVSGESGNEIAQNVGLTADHVMGILRHESYVNIIIDQQTWDAAQERLKNRTKRHRSGAEMKKEYLLTSKIECTCGKHMVGSSASSKNHKYYYYRCHNNCQKPLKRDDTDAAVVKALKDHLTKPENLEKIVDGVWDKYNRMKESGDASKAEKELKKVSERLERLYKAIEEGMTYESVKERIAGLEGQKNGLIEQIAKAKPTVNLTKDMVRKYLSNKEAFKNDLLLIETFVNRVAYRDGVLSVYVNVTDDVCINTELPWSIQVYTK